MATFMVPLALLLFWRMPLRTKPQLVSGSKSQYVTAFNYQHFIIISCFLACIWIIYFVAGDGGRGQGTLGKRLLGFKLVDDLGGPISSNRLFGRCTLKLACMPTVIGVLPIWGDRHQTFYDRVTHTVAVMQMEMVELRR
jgi:uncharacterized RDD family membrane protein YckC